jgi:glutathione S-transferase
MGMEDSQIICAYLDGLDGKPRFHKKAHTSNWPYLRLEFAARSLCDGISVWGREMTRPAGERSPTTLAHELARAGRMADFFEGNIADPAMQGPPTMAQLTLAVAIEIARKRGMSDLLAGRPGLSDWLPRLAALPSMQRTYPP